MSLRVSPSASLRSLISRSAFLRALSISRTSSSRASTLSLIVSTAVAIACVYAVVMSDESLPSAALYAVSRSPSISTSLSTSVAKFCAVVVARLPTAVLTLPISSISLSSNSSISMNVALRVTSSIIALGKANISAPLYQPINTLFTRVG